LRRKFAETKPLQPSIGEIKPTNSHQKIPGKEKGIVYRAKERKDPSEGRKRGVATSRWRTERKRKSQAKPTCPKGRGDPFALGKGGEPLKRKKGAAWATLLAEG